jgi:hypothetical protein
MASIVTTQAPEMAVLLMLFYNRWRKNDSRPLSNMCQGGDFAGNRKLLDNEKRKDAPLSKASVPLETFFKALKTDAH